MTKNTNQIKTTRFQLYTHIQQTDREREEGERDGQVDGAESGRKEMEIGERGEGGGDGG